VSRTSPPPNDRWSVRFTCCVALITEEAFHRALSCLPVVQYANDMAGETFLCDGSVFVRVNYHHFRIKDAGQLSHADALRLVGRSGGCAEASR